jgi:hypothetical protein
VEATEAKSVTPNTGAQVGRNDRCPCGSGRKYKQCCLGKDEEKARKARAKEAEKTAREAETAREAAEKSGEEGEDARRSEGSGPRRGHKPQTYQPWKKSATNTHAYQRMTTPRKVGGS